MTFDIKFKNGEFDLVAHGTVITASKEPTIITVQDDGNPMDIILKFERDKEHSKELEKSVKAIEGQNAIEITFKNYTSSLGHYTKEPWLIAHSNGRGLYLLYVISGFNDSLLQKIEYSFYLGEEINNG